MPEAVPQERHVGGIDAVIGAIGKVDGDINHRESERTALEILAYARLDRGYVLLGHHAAGDRVGKGEALAAPQRFDVDDHVAELAVPPGLFLVAGMLGRRFADGFLVRHLGPLPFHIDVEFALHLVHGDHQMHLALAP